MTKNPLVVVCDGFDKHLFDELCSTTGLSVHPQPKLKKEELKALLPTANGLVIRSDTRADKELIDQAPNLKYILRAGEGTDNIDKAYCQQKGIKVANTPGANNLSAAEHAISLIFSLLRKVPMAHQSMVEGKWDKNLYMGSELSYKNLGVLGFGRIGQILAKKLSGFDLKITYYDPFVPQEVSPYATKANTVDELFRDCDIITIHTPLTKETENLVDKRLLSLMKPTALLVNAARGKIVNEKDLAEALISKKIAGAALDVFEQEPLNPESPLRKAPRLILTPHLGASTEEAQTRVGKMAIQQVKEFFLNNHLVNEVKK